MLATAVKTHKIQPKESIFDILDRHIPKITENTVVAIASKIISTCENRFADITADKSFLIQTEAEKCFAAPIQHQDFCLTLKNHRLIPNAGIDESNCKNKYILLPKKPQLIAKKIWHHLRHKHRIKNLGVIITDSNITPLRSGVVGITLGWCGFEPTYSYIGKHDLYGKAFTVTKVNILDSLATTATFMMGEGQEQTPIAIIKHPPKINYQERAPTKKETAETHIEWQHDLFAEFYVRLNKNRASTKSQRKKP